ncbi:MAG: hypothetical protein HY303_04685 [Candidatus Wallbacteria bacterium]|nr:hypothetical protein [Candidatus Wallbacteria bacterium]
MIQSNFLDIALAMAFVYLLLSLMCSAVHEFIAAWLSFRHKHLLSAIRNLLDSGEPAATDLSRRVMAHPLVARISTGKPSYVPSRLFVTALLDVLIPNQAANAGGKSLDDLLAGASAPEDVKTALRSLARDVDGSWSELRDRVEDWYDHAMDRASGGYKRMSHYWMCGIGLALALVLNVDTLDLCGVLARDSAMAGKLADRAMEYARSAETAKAVEAAKSAPGTQPTTDPVARASSELKTATEIVRTLGGSGLPIGWNGRKCDSLPLKLLGLLLTAACVSLGAPFWFDALNKMTNVRTTLKPTAKAEKK